MDVSRNRKVDNIDFGFSFPTPSGTSRRSISKTPLTARRNSGRKSKTPSRASREPSVARSDRQGSTEVERTTSQQRSVVQTPGIGQSTRSTRSDGRSSSKRRRLNTGTGEFSVERSNLPRRSSAIRFEALDEEPLNSRFGEELAVPKDSAAITPDPTQEPSNYDDKENDRVGVQGKSTGPKRRKRKSIVQHIGKKKKRTSTESARELTTIPVEATEEEDVNIESNLIPEANPIAEANEIDEVSNDENPDVQENPPIEEAPLEKSAAQSNKRHKRKKSMLLTRTKRRSSAKAQSLNEHPLPTPEPTQERQSVESDDHDQVIDDQAQQSIEENEGEADVAPWKPGQTMIQRRLAAQKKRARMSISTSPAPRDEIEQEGDETYVEEEHTPEPPTPAPKKKQKRKRNSTSSDGSSSSTRQRQRGSTFPILTHRMTNTDALPTITEEDENDRDSEQEQDPLSNIFIDRSVPNAVDVLAQICRETIETTISKLSSQNQQQSKDASKPTSKSRAELKHNLTALTQFSQSLDTRLFTMSEAVEHRLNLDSRLRKIKREKAELQARWIEIRRQRDDLALRMDDVRRRNWEGERISRAKGEISELAQRTEVELYRDPVLPNEGEGDGGVGVGGLEFLLKSLGSLVSCRGIGSGNGSGSGGGGGGGGGGGVLERIRRFNDGLESLALKLEGRV